MGDKNNVHMNCNGKCVYICTLYSYLRKKSSAATWAILIDSQLSQIRSYDFTKNIFASSVNRCSINKTFSTLPQKSTFIGLVVNQRNSY